jgi:hypothetical protein
VGGFVALFLAIWRTWTAKLQADASLRQVTIAQKGQNTERFVKAVEVLSSDSASAFSSNRKTGYAPELGTGVETRTTVNITKLPELLRRGR